ncbi:hypothetical protein ACFV0R_06555 [Streptomyces sp. NPDC059578]|uniref:hypothetical protein n=1 Tax=Streptomyces sp. NPDC059578 TaxID=3346874 RepID=UPI0036AA86D9
MAVRRLLSTAAVAALVAGAALTAAPTAQADATAAPGTARTVANAQAHAAGWVYYGYRPNLGECIRAGQALVASGWTTAYRCDDGPWVTLLYVWE